MITSCDYYDIARANYRWGVERSHLWANSRADRKGPRIFVADSDEVDWDPSKEVKAQIAMDRKNARRRAAYAAKHQPGSLVPSTSAKDLPRGPRDPPAGGSSVAA